jgi:hypothetical protein
MGDLGMSALVAQSGGKLHSRNRIAGHVESSTHGSSCPVGAVVGPGPGRPDGAARRRGQRAAARGGVEQPADWTPHVLDGKVAAIQRHDHGSGRLVYTTGTLATVDFSGGLPTGSAPSSAAPSSTASPGNPEGCLSSKRHGVRPAPRWVWAGPVPVSCAPSAPVAQGTEQLSPKQQVAGSSPARGTGYLSSQVRRTRRFSREGCYPRPRGCTALDDPNNTGRPRDPV